MTKSIVVVGDSIFDNAQCVPDETCVTEQFQSIVRDGVDVSMLAVDGDYIKDVQAQVLDLPAQTTHVFVSAGGNDALSYSRKLDTDYLTSMELFVEWSALQKEFRQDYRSMLKAVVALDKHTTVCTIYDAVPGIEPAKINALSLFNDVITGEAVFAGLPIVDLRWGCTEASDYSPLSPIEPSNQGGAKIAAALNCVFEEHDFKSSRTSVYT